jgi:hypothetical protein
MFTLITPCLTRFKAALVRGGVDLLAVLLTANIIAAVRHREAMAAEVAPKSKYTNLQATLNACSAARVVASQFGRRRAPPPCGAGRCMISGAEL